MKGEGSSGATPRSAVQGLGAPDLDRFLVALQWIAFAFIGLLAVAGAIRNSLAMGAGALAVLLVLLTAAGARVLARHGRRTLATTLVAAAILVHAVVQAYWLPFGAPALIVSIVLAVAAVLPHFGDRALRRFAIAAVLGSAAVVLVARVSPHIEDVPSELQTAIVFLAVPAVTWLAVILLRQWKERLVTTIGEQARARTEAELAREEARRAWEQLQSILKSITEGVTVQTGDGQLLFANEAAARFFGFPSIEALLSTPLREMIRGFDIRAEDGSRFDLTKLPGRRALAGEQPEELLLRLRLLSTGQERWVMVASSPAFDEHGRVKFAVNVFRDHGERKRAEDAWRLLAEVSALLGSSLDTTTTLASVVKAAVPRIADRCAIDLVTDAGVERLASATVTGEPSRRPRPGRELPVADIATLMQPRLTQEESESEDADGSRAPRSTMVVPLVEQGRVMGAISFLGEPPRRPFDAQDLSLATEIAQRAALAIANSRLYTEAQEAIRARDSFLTIASHELKTPLTTMMLLVTGILKLARDGRPQSQSKLLERLSKLEDQGIYFSQLVSQMLDVGRISSQRIALDRTSLDLHALAVEVAERWRGQAERGGGSIEVCGNGTASGRWDRMRLEIVVTNLVANAVKYGGQGPIEIVVVDAATEAQLAVRDRGPGVDATDHERIFGQFERAAPPHAGGLGLGLWIVRQFVEAHGGRVGIESRPGEGATFTVTLPKEEKTS